MHGSKAIVEHVVDWRPFEYFTRRLELPVVGSMLMTFELEPAGGETTLRLRGEGVAGERRAAWDQIAPLMFEVLDPMLERLAVRLDEHSGR
jgi:hypothetical protein